jgi:quinone-modifying oxidoreductase, subunit QmoA
VLHGVDTEGYHRYANTHDLAVLAIGMQPSVNAAAIPAGVIADSSGFIEASMDGSGLFGAGCATNALDVNITF